MAHDDHSFDTIFSGAIEIASREERAAFVARACGTDEELHRRVERLVDAHFQAGSFLEPPPASLTASTAAAASIDVSGTVIGPYKLLQPIGEGGMGTVYMAEQTQPVRRTVALKLIKAGMDSRQVLARFGAERQALALMDHPNIARVFDAGTTDTGRPYFVMELVKGIPITRFCDERRLTTRERLELAIPVCQAVQHAHQKGIIHRDLKPSNVLVALYDGKPVPKVIDFGVAKATGPRLTDQTLYTEFGAVVGTLEYMSPEQAELNQLDIDTRSDIYSLGVLLYELLTGSTPLDRKRLKQGAILEMLRVIREEESPRPSMRLSTTEELPSIAACRSIEPRKLSGQVRGELDWIVMKALEKDRNRRYETANGLAADLRRYLDDEPVQACPPSGWYRLGKFARRHKAALTMAMVLLVAAAVAAGSLGWTARDRAARRTILEQQAVRALDDAQAHLDRGAWTEALSVVLRAQGILSGGGSPRLMERIAKRRADLELVARLEDIRLQLTDTKEGIEFDRECTAAAYAEAMLDFGLPVTDLAMDEVSQRIAASPIRPFLLAALFDWANLVPTDRTKLLTIALRADEDPWRRKLGDALVRDDRPAVLRMAQEPEALAQAPGTLGLLGYFLSRFDHPAAVELLSQAQRRHPEDLWINHGLGETHMRFQPPQAEEAIGYFRAALAIRPRSSAIHTNLGSALRARGLRDAAIAAVREAIRLDPNNVKAYVNLGAALHDEGRLDASIAAWRAAIRLKPDYALAHSNLGSALDDKGQLDAAIAELREAIRLKADLAEAHSNLSSALFHKGQFDAAIAAAREAIRLKPDLAEAHDNLGIALYHKGQFNASITEHREAIRLKPDLAEAHSNLGIALDDKGQLDAAIAELRKAIRLKPDLAETHDNLGTVLLHKGQLDAAIVQHREAIRLKSDFAQAHSNLGNALVQTGQLDAAIAEHREAIRLKPDFALAYSSLGNSLLHKGQFDAAIAASREAIRLEPDLASAHGTLGNALREKGQFDAAIAEYRETIRLKPDLAMAHDNLGSALLLHKGQFDAAIAEYREAIRLKPDFAQAHSHLGNTLIEHGKLVEGIALLERALTLAPDHPTALNTLAWVLATCPQPKYWDPRRAVELAKKAVELAPTQGANWNTLGVAQYRKGDWKAAIESLTKSMGVSKGGDSNDWFFLAMAHWQLGDKPQALTWFHKAIHGMHKNMPANGDLVRFRAEARALLEVDEQRY